MNLFTKAINFIREKAVGSPTVYGGMELLQKLTSGNWTKTKMLATYEKSLYVFACVSKIAEKTASADIALFRIINSKGDREEVLNHEALDLLFKPNPFQTKKEFLEITSINQSLTGDAFWFKVRADNGRVIELWNLRPDFITIVKSSTDFIKGYILHKADGSEEFFKPDEIVHFKKPSPLDEFYGASPLSSAKLRVEIEEFANKYQRDFFLNNARPDAILKSTNPITAAQKTDIRDAFGKRHRGVGKNSRIGIFEGGLEYQQISISQREMDYIESMKFTRDDILVAFQVPKPIVAITDDVNLANAKTALEIFLSQTIKPEVEAMTEKITQMLIMPDFGEELFLDFDDPTPENREKTVKEYETGINKWLTSNEVRAFENLPPLDGGDVMYQSLGLQPIGVSPAMEENPVKVWLKKQASEIRRKKLQIFRGKENLRQRFILVEEAKKMIMKNLEDAVFEKLKNKKSKSKKKTEEEPRSLIKGEDLRNKYVEVTLKAIEQRSEKLKNAVLVQAEKEELELFKVLNGIDDWTKIKRIKNADRRKAIGKNTKKAVKEFYKAQQVVQAELLFPFIEEYARMGGIEAMAFVNPDKGFELTPAILKSLEKRSELYGLSVSNTTRDKITKAISAGIEAGEGTAQIGDRILKVYKEYPTSRADLIARTETTAANNEGFIEAYKQSDVTHKEWIATQDDRTREEHLLLDGEIVAIGKNFSNGLEYPQEPNCRCVLAPATKG